MCRGRCAWIAGALLAFASVAGAQEPSPADVPPEVVNAVRVERQVDLVYMGFTTYYSCDGLRSKVRRVLEELGLGDGLKVTTRSCIRVSGPELMPMARIVARVPVEATPEVLAQLASDASKRELVARVKGEAPVEATAQFPARRKRVQFESSQLGDLQFGDCELMEQMRNRVFPALGVRVIEDRTHCAPRQVTLFPIHMVVEVLEAVPPAAP
jgi:hypothetical protein